MKCINHDISLENKHFRLRAIFFVFILFTFDCWFGLVYRIFTFARLLNAEFRRKIDRCIKVCVAWESKMNINVWFPRGSKMSKNGCMKQRVDFAEYHPRPLHGEIVSVLLAQKRHPDFDFDFKFTSWYFFFFFSNWVHLSTSIFQ